MCREAEQQQHVRGQIFIAGSEPITNATLTLQLADCTRQGAPARILDQIEISLAARPTSNWLSFGLTFSYPEPIADYRLSDMTIIARIELENGDLKYTTKTAHKIDISSGFAYATAVVVEPV